MAVREVYAMAFLVALWKMGVMTAVWYPRFVRRWWKARVCFRISCCVEHRRCMRRMLPKIRLWSGPFGCEECGGR